MTFQLPDVPLISQCTTRRVRRHSPHSDRSRRRSTSPRFRFRSDHVTGSGDRPLGSTSRRRFGRFPRCKAAVDVENSWNFAPTENSVLNIYYSQLHFCKAFAKQYWLFLVACFEDLVVVYSVNWNVKYIVKYSVDGLWRQTTDLYYFIQIPYRLFKSYVYHVAADKLVNMPTKMATSSVTRCWWTVCGRKYLLSEYVVS